MNDWQENCNSVPRCICKLSVALYKRGMYMQYYKRWQIQKKPFTETFPYPEKTDEIYMSIFSFIKYSVQVGKYDGQEQPRFVKLEISVN